MDKAKLLLLTLLALVAFATGARAEGETAYAVLDKTNKTLYFTYRAEVLNEGGNFTPEGSTDPVTISSLWSDTQVTASTNTPGWANNGNVKTVVFESSFAAVRPTTLQRWFYNCYNLTAINGISNLNTSEATSMAYMFYGCYNSGFTSLDLHTFNTGKVTTMQYMFSDCSYLTDINLSGWTNTLVTDMSYMFYSCQRLANLTLTGFATPAVTNMKYMFSSCKVLSSLDLSSFTTDEVTNMNSMFYQCLELTSLDLSGWTNTKVTDMASMFYQCKKLETLILTGFGTPAVQYMTGMFNGCNVLTSLDLSSFNTANVTSMGSMFNNCNSLQSITLSTNFNTAYVTNMSSMFNGCSMLQAVDVSDFNTAKVTTMANMFKGCSSLTSIDVSSFSSAGMPTSGSDNGYLYCMFQDCSNLETITLGSNLCTNKVQSVQSMFQGCAKLKNIDTSLLNLSKASYLTHLFDGCSSLESIDLSGTTFVSNVSNLGLDYMFNGCSSLTNLKLPSSSVKAGSIKYMFAGCSSLENITLPVIEIDITREWGVAVQYVFSGCSSVKTINLNGLDVRYTYNFSNMFEGCSALQSLDLSGFDTKNVTDMSSMFKGCSTLTTLDLSKFNTANVTSMNEMFSGCSQMESIYVSCAWTAYNATSTDMFKDCTAIVGQDGTTYIASSVDGTRATDEEGGYMKTGTDTPVEPTAYAIWVDEDTPFYFLQSTKQLVPGRKFTPEGSSTPVRMTKVWSGEEVSASQSYPDWSRYSNIPSKVVSVVFESSFANVHPNTMAEWFKGFTKLTTLTGLEYLEPTGSIKSMGYAFSGCTSLESIDLSSLNMSMVIYMDYMFQGCTNLTSVTGLKTPAVTSMSYMFQNCTALEDLDLSSLNTAKVTNMSYMFSGCTKLKNLNVKGFNTSLVTNMNYMFQNCKALQTLDLTSFNTAKLTQTSYMFDGCSELVSIYEFPGTWDVSGINQYSSYYMFRGCTNIVGQDGTTYNSSKVIATYAHANTGGYMRAADMPVAIWCSGNNTLYFVKTSDAVGVGKTFMPEGSTSGVTVTNIWVGDEVENTLVHRDALFKTPNWNSYQYSVRDAATRVVFESTFADVRPNCTSGWFNLFKNLTTVDGLNNLNTSGVTDMSRMFYNCNKLTSLNVSNFITNNVTDMKELFYECEVLSTLTGLNHFNTASVTNMHGMFSGCWALTTIDVSSFDTRNVTDMGDMFGRCVGLTSLNLSNFITDKVTDMSSMFQSIKLPSIDIRHFDTSNVTDMSCMFWLSHVEDVNMRGLNTGKVTTMYQMFYECPNLVSLDMGGLNTASLTDVRMMLSDCPNLERVDLSGWTNEKLTSLPWLFDGDSKLKEVILTDFKTDNIVSMMRSFYGCSSLATLDLSSFNTSKVTNMYGLFIGCTGLKSVIVGNDWTTANLKESVYIGTSYVNGKADVFKNCTSIVGEDGTAFDASYTDATRAHNGTGGYLRMKHDSWTVTVPTSGIATFSADRNVTIPDGLTAYTCTNYSNGIINASELSGTIIPAETGVLLKGEAGQTFTLNATTDKASTVSGNALVAVTAPTHVTPTEGDMTNFMLKSGNFIRIAESSNNMPANKSYLQIATADLPASGRIALRWDDGSLTGISNVVPDRFANGATYYDLQGRRVQQSHRGLVIERTAEGTRTIIR